MATLCGMSTWVIPVEQLRVGLNAIPTGPLATLPHWQLSLAAAIVGAALGFLAAQIARRHAEHEHKPDVGKAQAAPPKRPYSAQILQVDELQLPDGFDNQELLLGTTVAPALADHHGAAIAKLRDKPIAELSLIQLVERFAVALEGRRMADAIAPAPAELHRDARASEAALQQALEKLQQMASAA